MDELKREGAEIVKENASETKVLQNGGYPMHTFEDVKEIYYAYIHDEKDRKLIESAYNFVKIKHDGIFRKSGEPYLQHLIEVAYIVASLQGGPVTIAAAFLHDVVEDTDTTIDDIKKKFGEDCARIVDALTKIQRLKCKHCGRTHAILIHFLVPYKRKTIYEIKQIINDHEEGNGVLVTEYFIVKTYKKWKQRLISINCLISSIWKKYVAFLMECADVFKMCFMQNRRRKYWCRGKEYEVIYAN